MDWRHLLSAFSVVFLAELGDKTQLTTLALAATGRSRWGVFIAAAAALVLSAAIATVAGAALARVIPPLWIKRAAAIGFMLTGTWMLWNSRV